MRTLCLTIAFVMAIAMSAAGRDIFVNNQGGDDVRDGGQPTSTVGSGPLRTIGRALEICEPGDRIVLAATNEPYRESLSLSTGRHCGSGLQPLVIEGNGAVLDGSIPVPRGAWEPYRGPVFRFRPVRSSFQQLFLADKPAKQRKLEPDERKLPDLQPLEWCRHDAWIYFRVEDDKLPQDYPLSYSGLKMGITLYQVHDVVISDLIVQGFQLDGVNAHDGVRRCDLRKLTCRGNGRSGVTSAGASRIRLVECAIGDNGAAQLRTEGLAWLAAEGCELIDNTAPAFVRRGGRIFIDGAPQGEP